ncbi:MAG: DEAD/DEAH box helicase [Planctomycetes bacterium]|nr:DEAD/DEAH box helicase [Planctomycetota bacterium]
MTQDSTTGAIRFDAGTLTLQGLPASAVKLLFSDVPWKWDPRSDCWRCDALHYRRIAEIVRLCQIDLDVPIASEASVVFPSMNLPPLRMEQQNGLAAWLSTRNGVVVMPTGTGKTEVALQAMAESRCTTLIVAPVRDLMYQWHRRILRGLSYDAGILGDSVMNIRAVTVTTYASACIHMPKIGDRFDLLIFDECHHLTGPIRSDAARQSIATQRLGLTATLEPTDAAMEHIEHLIGPVVYRLPIMEVRGKTLADYDVVRIPVKLNPPERARYDLLAEQIASYVYQRREEDPAFQWRDLSAESLIDGTASKILKAFREKESIEERAEEKFRVLEDLFRLHLGSPIIVFTGSNLMAREISIRFLIPCLLSHCGKRERLDYLEGLRDGVYPALIANQVLDEGVDLPEVKVAVILGGKATTRQAKQRLGRILRRRGDARATLYEVVTEDTNEVKRSRKRRRNDAYPRARHRPS